MEDGGIIRVFGPYARAFSDGSGRPLNGPLGNIRPIRAEISQEMNGEYCLEAEVGAEDAPLLAPGNILVAERPALRFYDTGGVRNASLSTSAQGFRVRNRTLTPYKATVKAEHVSRDCARNVYAGDPGAPDTFYAAFPYSNIELRGELADKTFSPEKGTNALDALHGIAEAAGGFLEFDNWAASLSYDDAGKDPDRSFRDRGVSVEYGKNLRDASCEEDWGSVCTRVYAEGKDGIRLTADRYTEGAEAVPQYLDEYDAVQTFDAATEDDLRKAAVGYLLDNCVPKASRTVSAREDGFAGLGDVARIRDPRVGLDEEATLSAFRYDCVRRTYTDLVFGNFRRTVRGDARYPAAVAIRGDAEDFAEARGHLDTLGITGDNYDLREFYAAPFSSASGLPEAAVRHTEDESHSCFGIFLDAPAGRVRADATILLEGGDAVRAGIAVFDWRAAEEKYDIHGSITDIFRQMPNDARFDAQGHPQGHTCYPVVGPPFFADTGFLDLSRPVRVPGVAGTAYDRGSRSIRLSGLEMTPEAGFSAHPSGDGAGTYMSGILVPFVQAGEQTRRPCTVRCSVLLRIMYL